MTANTVRSLAIYVSVLTSLVLGSARIASAQPGTPSAAGQPFVLNFDEAGNSSLTIGGAPAPNLVVPVAGGGINFYLPTTVQTGQVLINNSVEGDSDLLTFSNGPDPIIPGQIDGIMLYESLIADATDTDKADVVRLNYVAPIAMIAENGPEGNNGFVYGVLGATYNGLSDGYLPTPEPSTLVLSGLALASLATLAYRRRRARTR